MISIAKAMNSAESTTNSPADASTTITNHSAAYTGRVLVITFTADRIASAKTRSRTASPPPRSRLALFQPAGTTGPQPRTEKEPQPAERRRSEQRAQHARRIAPTLPRHQQPHATAPSTVAT